MILPPCKDCENREIGCHSRCVAYIKYKSELNDAKKESAAAFNILGAMEMEAKHKELVDLPNRTGKDTFDYE